MFSRVVDSLEDSSFIRPDCSLSGLADGLWVEGDFSLGCLEADLLLSGRCGVPGLGLGRGRDGIGTGLLVVGDMVGPADGEVSLTLGGVDDEGGLDGSTTAGSVLTLSVGCTSSGVSVRGVGTVAMRLLS